MSQPRDNCRLVLLDPLNKALEFTELAGATFRQPAIKLLSFSVMKQVPKFLD